MQFFDAAGQHPRTSGALYSSHPWRIGVVAGTYLGRVDCQICPVLVVLQIGSHAMAMLKHFTELILIQSYLNELALNVAEVALGDQQSKTSSRMIAPDGHGFHGDCLFL
jgi:hypothetical protein